MCTHLIGHNHSWSAKEDPLLHLTPILPQPTNGFLFDYHTLTFVWFTLFLPPQILRQSLPTLITPISVISHPYLDKLINSLAMPTPTYSLDAIELFPTRNSQSITLHHNWRYFQKCRCQVLMTPLTSSL